MIREERNALILLLVFAAAAASLYFLVLRPALEQATLPRERNASESDGDPSRAERGNAVLLERRPKEARRMVTLAAYVRDAATGDIPSEIDAEVFGVDDVADPLATVLPEGRLLVEYLPPRIRFSVRIRARGCRERDYHDLLADARSVIDLGVVALEPRRTLRGEVRDRDGRPVQDATIAAYPCHAFPKTGIGRAAALSGALFSSPAATTRTDERGRFEISGLRPVPHAIAAEKRDLVSCAMPLEELALSDAIVEFRLSGGAVQKGRVLGEDGTPLGSADVLWIEDAFDLEETVSFSRFRADELGAFTTGPLSASRYYVIAFHDAAAPSATGPYLGLLDRVEARFPAGYPLEGVVLNPLRRPIRAAEVTLLASSPGFVARRTTTDDAGRFSLQGAMFGTAWVECRAPGLSTARTAVAVASFGAEPVSIRLDEGAELRGRVLSGDRPICGAVVTTDVGRVRALSGVDGSYRLSHLPRGEVDIAAFAPGYARRTGRAQAGDDAWRDIPLQESPPVRVRVSEPSGRPRAAARVMALPDDATAAPVADAHTGSDGVAVLPSLPPGRYRLVAHAFGHPPALSDPVEIAPGGELKFSLRLPMPCAVEGLVVAPDGAGRGDVAVTVVADPRDPWLGRLMSIHDATVLTRADGSFRCDGLPAGRVRALAIAPDGKSGATDPIGLLPGAVATGESVALGERGWLRGSVRDRSGRPVAGASVRYSGAGSDPPAFRFEATDARGRFVLPAPLRDSWSIEVSAPGSEPTLVPLARPGDAPVTVTIGAP